MTSDKAPAPYQIPEFGADFGPLIPGLNLEKVGSWMVGPGTNFQLSDTRIPTNLAVKRHLIHEYTL